MTISVKGARLATALLVCGCAAPAAAQRTAGDDTPVGNSAVAGTSGGFGSFLGNGASALVRGLTIEGRVQTLYESNIRRFGDGQILGAGRDKADFRISPSVIATNVVPFGRQELYVTGEYGRDFYLRSTDLNRDRYSFGAGVNARAGNFCTGALSTRYAQRQSLLSEASISDENVIETRYYTGSLSCQRPVGIGFGLNASRDERDNKSVFRNLLDARTTSFGGNLSYSRPVLGQFTVGGNYSKVDYPRRSVAVDDGGALGSAGDGVDIYSANAGYRRSIGPRLTVNIGGSYYIAKPDPKNILIPVSIPMQLYTPLEREDFSGAGYTLGVAYRPGPRLTADFRGARDISQSSSVGALFVVRDSFAADFGYALGPSISTGVGVSYDIRRYKNSFVSIEEPQARVRDAIDRVYARVTYAPRRLFDVDFEVGRQHRASKPSIYSYNSVSAALTLRVRFGRG